MPARVSVAVFAAADVVVAAAFAGADFPHCNFTLSPAGTPPCLGLSRSLVVARQNARLHKLQLQHLHNFTIAFLII